MLPGRNIGIHCSLLTSTTRDQINELESWCRYICFWYSLVFSSSTLSSSDSDNAQHTLPPLSTEELGAVEGFCQLSPIYYFSHSPTPPRPRASPAVCLWESWTLALHRFSWAAPPWSSARQMLLHQPSSFPTGHSRRCLVQPPEVCWAHTSANATTEEPSSFCIWKW